MKLIVEKGELSIPEGFSFEIQQNSAFFSEDGAASVATTIPATPADLAKLDNPTRIARRNRFVNLFPAMISQGVFRKKGTLVVNSASEDGITCAVALEDSDFYSNWKDAQLKELFSSIVDRTYSTPADWYEWLFKVYRTQVESDFRLIPVAVCGADGEYKVNNEPEWPSSYDDDTIFELAHSVRIETDGEERISVPDGYGIAPFLKLHVFFERLFGLCGYSVGRNCFRTNGDLSELILLHNCSDVICNARIDYSDLVPNKTVSEVLEWMRKKFHAQIVVHPSESSVDIVLLEDILSAGYDADLTGRLIGNATISFSPSSRVVLSPDTSLDGAAPAAETQEDLLKKYGCVIESDRAGTTDIGLVLDLATGVYSEASAPFSKVSARDTDYSTRMNRIGTNYFSYDRRNSKEFVSMDPCDLMPPMVFVKGFLMPFIGNRTHRNTSYNNSEKDEDQPIIIVEYAGRSVMGYDSTGGRLPGGPSEKMAGLHYYYGTTQKYDNRGRLRPGRYNLTGPDLFQRFFRRYNKMLLNGLAKLEGRFDIPVEEILSYRMYSLKMFGGQMLLPVSLQYEVGRNVRCRTAEFYQVKDYEDGMDDEPTEIPSAAFRWELNDSEVEAAMRKYTSPTGTTVTAKFEDDYSSGDKDFFISAPTAAGQKSAVIGRHVEIGYYTIRNTTERVWNSLGSADVDVWFESVPI